jgi:hypothetical protein
VLKRHRVAQLLQLLPENQLAARSPIPPTSDTSALASSGRAWQLWLREGRQLKLKLSAAVRPSLPQSTSIGGGSFFNQGLNDPSALENMAGRLGAQLLPIIRPAAALGQGEWRSCGVGHGTSSTSCGTVVSWCSSMLLCRGGYHS